MLNVSTANKEPSTRGIPEESANKESRKRNGFGDGREVGIDIAGWRRF